MLATDWKVFSIYFIFRDTQMNSIIGRKSSISFDEKKYS